ncbi:hypothetical protein CEXT_409431 [Caerostris extrusa]|uniref:Uncharacterized protein n=1 Tax=Caerostris extrusa TaxID=172846 RepID=A0AAV4XZX2_CAEEX|nr:hypothetical protein CEXT_409431 [Caerostris extrusa]
MYGIHLGSFQISCCLAQLVLCSLLFEEKQFVPNGRLPFPYLLSDNFSAGERTSEKPKKVPRKEPETIFEFATNVPVPVKNVSKRKARKVGSALQLSQRSARAWSQTCREIVQALPTNKDSHSKTCGAAFLHRRHRFALYRQHTKLFLT